MTDHQSRDAPRPTTPRPDAPRSQVAPNPKQAEGSKKVPFSYLPATVMAEVAVGMYEGKKYGRHNYREVGEILASIYYDATLRHMAAWWEGQDADPDSALRLSHVTKAIASLVVLRDSMIQGRFKDDRPPRAPDGWVDKLNSDVQRLNETNPDTKPPHTHLKD